MWNVKCEMWKVVGVITDMKCHLSKCMVSMPIYDSVHSSQVQLVHIYMYWKNQKAAKFLRIITNIACLLSKHITFFQKISLYLKNYFSVAIKRDKISDWGRLFYFHHTSPCSHPGWPVHIYVSRTNSFCPHVFPMAKTTAYATCLANEASKGQPRKANRPCPCVFGQRTDCPFAC